MPKYVLLSGAKANCGDHLILFRAKQLIQRHVPNSKLFVLERWKPLYEHLDLINNSDALILCGGPALQRNLYPGIYPLVDNIKKIRVPIIGFGLGWYKFPGDEFDLKTFSFSRSSDPLIQRLREDGTYVSCRDFNAVRVLIKHGVKNVLMTGDPAWYDPLHIDNSFRFPKYVKVIAVSMPRSSVYQNQAIKLVRQVRKEFPEARVICTFHHGWSAGPYVSEEFANRMRTMKEMLQKEGVICYSLAYSVQKMMTVYDKADMHVGYRLHAHFYFLSQRKPSFLLEEDGRGQGASEALGIRSVRAWRRPSFVACVPSTLSKIPFVRRIFYKIHPYSDAIDEIMEMIRNEVEYGFPHFCGLEDTIKTFYKNALVPFLESLPGAKSDIEKTG